MTDIVIIRNRMPDAANIKNIESGTGYQVLSGASESVLLNVPWGEPLGQTAGPNDPPQHYILVTFPDGQGAILFERQGTIFVGPDVRTFAPAFPMSKADGKRDLVIGKYGLEVHIGGASPEGDDGSSDYASSAVASTPYAAPGSHS